MPMKEISLPEFQLRFAALMDNLRLYLQHLNFDNKANNNSPSSTDQMTDLAVCVEVNKRASTSKGMLYIPVIQCLMV